MKIPATVIGHAAIVVALALLPVGCQTLQQQQDDASSMVLIKETVSPLNEYYIGRSVTASILSRYRTYDDRAVNTYVSMVGQTLAMSSARPELYGGYHFSVLDTNEVCAFAAPGGFVMISLGLLKCCESEDALAAVLAHEIAHIQLFHGLQAIKKHRLTRSFSRTRLMHTMNAMAPTSLSHMRAPHALQMSAILENTIFDISSVMIINGYSRKAEEEADALAVDIMARTGYDPSAFISVLSAMAKRFSGGDARGFARTHPAPDSRIEAVRAKTTAPGQSPPPASRQARFKLALARI